MRQSIFEAFHRLLHHAHLDIDGFVQFHETINMVSEMTYALFHPRESIVHIAFQRAHLNFNCADPVIKLIDSFINLGKPAVDLNKPSANLTESSVYLIEFFVDFSKPLIDLSEPDIDLNKPVVDLTEALVDLTKALLGLLKAPTDQPLKTCELPFYARGLLCRSFLRHRSSTRLLNRSTN